MKPRMLILCSRKLPHPLAAGFGLRIFHLARFLSEVYHVDFLFLNRQAQGANTPGEIQALQSVFRQVFSFPFSDGRYLANALNGLLSPDPVQVRTFAFPEVRQWLQEHQHDYRIILGNHVRVGEWVKGLEVPVALDLHDAISLNYERAIPHVRGPYRWLYQLERSRLLRYEVELANRFPCFLVSEVDRQHLLEHGADPEKLRTIPLAVPDAALQRPAYEGPEEERMAFLGKMDYHPNRDAAMTLAKEILPRLPGCGLTLVGARPPKDVQELASDRITVTGFVEDPYAYLERAKVVVAPLRFGAGVQTKVLEAMALGKAVVLSSIAASAIGGRDGQDYWVADSPEAFSAAVRQLLADEPLRRRMGARARAHIERYFTWDAIGKKFLDALCSLQTGIKLET
ncbi:MAG: glycosyltransferase [Bacteroidota bacterium]